ncbi:hypothetical protein PROFUN_07393 [Planoprotostelium fungivorum]|uniref:Uncharacterized protein n=1 Tax=Planoprotostelium fungivorum TaxID=1890364 RepID=A0A2P6MTH0_9EUKA|nr:hypothetical protein PROFUN_07393 [Planoprotostelium fungivorum]
MDNNSPLQSLKAQLHDKSNEFSRHHDEILTFINFVEEQLVITRRDLANEKALIQKQREENEQKYREICDREQRTAADAHNMWLKWQDLHTRVKKFDAESAELKAKLAKDADFNRQYYQRVKELDRKVRLRNEMLENKETEIKDWENSHILSFNTSRFSHDISHTPDVTRQIVEQKLQFEREIEAHKSSAGRLLEAQKKQLQRHYEAQLESLREELEQARSTHWREDGNDGRYLQENRIRDELINLEKKYSARLEAQRNSYEKEIDSLRGRIKHLEQQIDVQRSTLTRQFEHQLETERSAMNRRREEEKSSADLRYDAMREKLLESHRVNMEELKRTLENKYEQQISIYKSNLETQKSLLEAQKTLSAKQAKKFAEDSRILMETSSRESESDMVKKMSSKLDSMKKQMEREIQEAKGRLEEEKKRMEQNEMIERKKLEVEKGRMEEQEKLSRKMIEMSQMQLEQERQAFDIEMMKRSTEIDKKMVELEMKESRLKGKEFAMDDTMNQLFDKRPADQSIETKDFSISRERSYPFADEKFFESSIDARFNGMISNGSILSDMNDDAKREEKEELDLSNLIHSTTSQSVDRRVVDREYASTSHISPISSTKGVDHFVETNGLEQSSFKNGNSFQSSFESGKMRRASPRNKSVDSNRVRSRIPNVRMSSDSDSDFTDDFSETRNEVRRMIPSSQFSDLDDEVEGIIQGRINRMSLEQIAEQDSQVLSGKIFDTEAETDGDMSLSDLHSLQPHGLETPKEDLSTLHARPSRATESLNDRSEAFARVRRDLHGIPLVPSFPTIRKSVRNLACNSVVHYKKGKLKVL